MLTNLIHILTKTQTKLACVENKEESLFEDLTPSTDIDENGKYTEAITWGLENNDVKNIALTGPYGSGKSSLLKTYEKKYKNTYRFLNISLATFRPEEGHNGENDLEKSILQQMFYRVKDRTIPFSRFKRIKHVKNHDIIFYLVILMASVTAGIHLLQPTYFEGIFQGTLFQQNITSGNLLSVFRLLFLTGVTLLFPFFFLKHIYSFFRSNLNFNKVTIANTTIEKNGLDAQSTFDKYLDEILYFFEATDYDVVVFEDLDRFDNLIIFERLRELNALINNSEQIKRKIVFIYAIKDEIFGSVSKDKEKVQDTIDFSKNRTKFFDFIIPVIPIINSSNSIDKLTKKIDKLAYGDKLSRSFLNDVTIYIDDMRILKNIFNEFIIYKEKLGSIDLDLNKLLAMVIYKNIYPLDFSQLQFKKGLVYDVLQSKSRIINTQTQKLETEISKLEEKIINTEQETLTSLKELQVSYLHELGIYKRHQYNAYFINIGTKPYNTNNNFNMQDFFDSLKQAGRVQYNLPERGNKQTDSEQIATVFGSKKNYFERAESIRLREEGMIDKIKEEVAQLKWQKAEVSAKSLKELIEESNPRDIFAEVIYYEKLLVYLLRHGYIDEMYNHYLTYFHPGSLTEEDMKFIFSVKNYEQLEANHSLNNIDKVIERLNGNEFRQKEILNYNLLNHLMDNIQRPYYQKFYDTIITQLTNEERETIEFIDEFRRITPHKPRFIQSICKEWDNIWHYIEKESNFTDERKNSYASDILAFADISDIKKINRGQEFSRFIERHNDFLNIAPINTNKRNEILLILDVKFLDLEKLTSDEELIKYVVEKELYEINPDTLATILHTTPNKLSYSVIKRTNRQEVIDYIDAHIGIYIEQVLLKVAIAEETEEALIDLLNRNEILTDLQETIIDKQSVLITDINKLIVEVWPMLISYKKIKVSWSNVIAYFQEWECIDSELVNFLNDSEIAEELSAQYIGEGNDATEETILEMSKEIINNQDITEASFKKLVGSIDKFSSIQIDTLPKKRVETMITHGILALSLENYKSLKTDFNDLVFLYLEINIDQFIENVEEYQLNHKVFVNLFYSERISRNYKISLIERLDVAILSSEDTIFAEELADFILKNSVELSIKLFNWLIDVEIKIDYKLMLICKIINDLDFSAITDLLKKLGDPYLEIAEKGKRPQIRNSEVHKNFVQTLDKKSYISSFNVKGDKIRINTKLK